MKVGDLIVKVKGMKAGSTGVIMRVYNKNNDGHLILEVLSCGEIYQWSADWCSVAREKTCE